MENVEIRMEKTKKGKVVGYFVIKGESKAEDKSIPFPSWLDGQLPLEKNGQVCQLLREKGQPVKMVFEGKEYNKPVQKQQTQHQHGGGQVRNRQQPGYNPANRNRSTHMQTQAPGNVPRAVAPYNFVPLNTKVIFSKNQGAIPMDSYFVGNEGAENGEKLYSGRIEINLETKTPFFVRGNINQASSDQGTKDYDFFSPGGRIKIPGSSIRGMVRTLVEIVCYGKFDNTDGERQLFYRFIAEPPPLGDEYRGRMTDQSNNHYPRIEAGLLKKSGQTYKIQPAQSEPHGQIFRVSYNPSSGSLTCNSSIILRPRPGDNYAFRKVYFRTVSPDNHNHSRGRQLRYALVDQVFDRPPGNSSGLREGYLISSGKMPNKHMQWLINEIDTRATEKIIPAEVIDNYTKDESRSAVNLLELPEVKKGGVPCFYLSDAAGNVISFGHTGMFRLAYDKKIAEHLPGTIINTGERYDLAESIFGVESKFASRLFVEDAMIAPGQQDPFLHSEHKHPKILSTPKPTTVQHYLMQGEDDNIHAVVSRGSLKSWNSNKYLRGFKLYWHRNINGLADTSLHSWVALPDQVERYKTQYEYRIKPLKQGVKFNGCLRFENLAAYELGALLFVLALPDNCYHKLGLAKPLGFGSVKIEPELVLTLRAERYKKLFSKDNAWYLAEEKGDIEYFKQVFAKNALEQLEPNIEQEDTKAVARLWNQGRLKELKQLLSWCPENTSWLEKTKYMNIDGPPGLRFRERPVLPLPSQVRGN